MFSIFRNEAFRKGITCVTLFVFLVGWHPLTKGVAIQAENLEPSQKHETIFANLDHRGNLIEVLVVNSFLRPGESVIDYGDYSKIINLTNDSAYANKEGRIIFNNTGDENIFRYQGTLDTLKLPWDFDIAYYLDGKSIKAQELPGASGRLRIVINAAYDPKAHPYFIENFMAQIRIPLQMDKASAINAPDASVMFAGNLATVAFTLMPKSARQFLVEADVINFAMDGIDIAAMKAVIPANEEIEKIESGFDEMAQGTQELVEGTEKLKTGMVELQDGVEKLFDGAVNVSRGASGLSIGLDEFSDAFVAMESGLNNITAGSEGFDQALTAISKAMPQLTGGYENIESGLNSMLANKEGINVLALSLATSQDLQVRKLAEAMLMQLSALLELQGGLKRANEALSTHSGGISEISARFGEFSQGLGQSAAGAQGLNKGFDDMKTAARRLSSGTQSLRGGLGELKDNVVTLPEDVQKLVDGQKDLKEGVLLAKDEIRQFIDGGGELKTKSFVSPPYANAETVQFIMRTPPVEAHESPKSYERIEERRSIWDRFLDLFRMTAAIPLNDLPAVVPRVKELPLLP